MVPKKIPIEVQENMLTATPNKNKGIYHTNGNQSTTNTIIIKYKNETNRTNIPLDHTIHLNKTKV
ncbi:hypothetical protein ACQWHR_24925, partial [Salmonella enterica subsp. enterica serovar Infantis]